MAVYRTTAPALMLAHFKLLLGDHYSEKSPSGSYADGHLWVPGNGTPTYFDCSGATKYVVYYVCGFDIDKENEGNAIGQWQHWAPLRVASPLPGDLLFFRGATPPVGHTGMCVTFDAKTGLGTYISAYDTDDGVCIKPFDIHGGTDGYVGAVRIANQLPNPPVVKTILAAVATMIKSPVTVAAKRTLSSPAPIICTHPGNEGKALCYVPQQLWQGIPDQTQLARLEGVGTKQGTVPDAWWMNARQVKW